MVSLKTYIYPQIKTNYLFDYATGTNGKNKNETVTNIQIKYLLPY